MRKKGFTLIELLLVLALAGATLSLSIHTFKQLSERRLLSQPLAALIKTLRFARAAAIASGRDVTLCHSEGDGLCNGAGYERGWIVFADHNGDGARDPAERVLAAGAPLNARLTLRANTFASRITFRPDGRANNNGRFVICADGNPAGAVGVFVNHSGRLRPATAGELDQCLIS